MFLRIRNLATCFSLGMFGQPDFSRNSALRLGTRSIPIPFDAYSVLERSRVLSTRGFGGNVTISDVEVVRRTLSTIEEWAEMLVKAKRKCMNL